MARPQADKATKGKGQVNGISGSVDTRSAAQKPLNKAPTLSKRTDYTRWRLLDERGRQTWHYLENDEDAKEWPQTTADKYFLGLPTVCTLPLLQFLF